MKKSLYNISEELLSLQEMLHSETAETGEISPESEELLIISQNELSVKVQGYRDIIRTWEGENTQIDKQIAELQAWKETNVKSTKRLEGALLQALLLFGEEDTKGVKRLQLGLNKLSTRKSKSIVIEDEKSIDDEYKTYSVTVSGLNNEEKDLLEITVDGSPRIITPKESISKTLIKKAIDSGKAVSGASQETKIGLTLK